MQNLSVLCSHTVLQLTVETFSLLGVPVSGILLSFLEGGGRGRGGGGGGGGVGQFHNSGAIPHLQSIYTKEPLTAGNFMQMEQRMVKGFAGPCCCFSKILLS